jgi:hypothetical protein
MDDCIERGIIMTTFTQGRVVSGLAEAGGGLKQLVSEDNGRGSAMRAWGFMILGLVAFDVMERGNPLSWTHVGIFLVLAIMKVGQKWAEKPAQGVINARALENMMQGVADKIITRGGTGGKG